MATAKIYNGSSWVPAVGKTWNGSAWETQMKFWDGSSWVELYASGPTVNVSNQTNYQSSVSPFNCVSGVQINSNGFWYKSSNNGSYITNIGTWLASGLNSEVWVQRIINSGSLNIDAGSGRLQLSSTRTFSVLDTTTGGGAVECGLTLNFYDAATGGNLIGSCTFYLSAIKEL